MIINPEQSIVQTMNLVEGDLAKLGIAKNQKNTQQNYAYRGIDPLYDTIAPIYTQHGLIITPRVIWFDRSIATTEKEYNGKKTVQTAVTVIVKVEYTFRHVHNEQSLITEFYGEATDYSDKATNKATTAAYKYMVIQTFNIPINGTDNDADNNSPEIIQPIKINSTTGTIKTLLFNNGTAPKITMESLEALYNSKREYLDPKYTAKLDAVITHKTKPGDLNEIFNWLQKS